MELQVLAVPRDQHASNFDWIFDMFRKPTAEALAVREYEESRRNLLQCERMRDYYDNMVRFESQRVKRLRELLQLDAG